jgi:simple sugar transport system ATP-binding protein
MFEGQIVADVDPKKTTIQEMGLYMAGVRKEEAQHA